MNRGGEGNGYYGNDNYRDSGYGRSGMDGGGSGGGGPSSLLGEYPAGRGGDNSFMSTPSRKVLVLVCLILFFTSHQQSFSLTGTSLPGLNQY